MLKKRIIPVQLLLEGRLVKTVGFGDYRDVGDPVQSSKVYSDQDADELVFLNISRAERNIRQLIEVLERVSEVCFMPLALGGGIRALEDAQVLIKSGADKVVVNSAVYRDPTLLSRIAERFGSQAVVASVDARRSAGGYELYSDCGRVREEVDLEDHVRTIVSHGAGEVFVNSIDRDGTMSGYDVELIERVTRAAGVPVIACGGAGTYEHMKQAFCATSVSALACGSLFNFGDNNPIRAKAFLSNYGLAFKVI
jgi:imidazole glycerol-phosphate synthase subunit HisF